MRKLWKILIACPNVQSRFGTQSRSFQIMCHMIALYVSKFWNKLHFIENQYWVSRHSILIWSSNQIVPDAMSTDSSECKQIFLKKIVRQLKKMGSRLVSDFVLYAKKGENIYGSHLLLGHK